MIRNRVTGDWFRAFCLAPKLVGNRPSSIIVLCCDVRIDRHLGTFAVQLTRPPCLWQLARKARLLPLTASGTRVIEYRLHIYTR